MAAYEVLVDEGYHAATVQNVARRAKLTTGAIYANFVSKHELLVQAVLERWAQSPELNPLQLLPSPAAEPSSPGKPGSDPDADLDLGDAERVSDGVGTGAAAAAGIDELVDFLADQLTAAPSPEHRLLTEVAGAAIRHDIAMSRLRSGIDLVQAFAREAIVQAQAEGRLDARLPTDVLVTLAVNLYLGAITSKSFDLPQPDRDAIAQLLTLLRLAPAEPAPAPEPDG
jgi:AcrR family transcriptional regulator